MDFPKLFLEGVSHFNSRDFWEAHESWEELWLEAGTDAHQYLQGLIQLAAAYHHIKRGTLSGAIRLIDASLAKLEAFPVVYLGLDRSAAVAAALRDREHLRRGQPAGEFPMLAVVSEVPPLASW
jgi:predicted metal-dependent hydrolase